MFILFLQAGSCEQPAGARTSRWWWWSPAGTQCYTKHCKTKVTPTGNNKISPDSKKAASLPHQWSILHCAKEWMYHSVLCQTAIINYAMNSSVYLLLFNMPKEINKTHWSYKSCGNVFIHSYLKDKYITFIQSLDLQVSF